MGCFLGCLALAFPRIALALLWLFDAPYLTAAYGRAWIWPLLGFFFMPLTTIAFAYAMDSLGRPGEVPPLGWALIVLAGLLDLGIIGNGGREARRRR